MDTQLSVTLYNLFREKRHRRTETEENKNKSSWSNRCLSPIFKVSTRYRPNTYYLIIQGRYSVPEKDVHRCRQDVGERGGEGNNSIDLTPPSMLHPCTWSFPCWLLKRMSCLWASRVSLRTAVVSHGFVTRARKTESTEADDALCLSTWMGKNRPMGGKGICGFRAGAGSSESKVQGDMNQRITPRPPTTSPPNPPPPPWK